MWYNVREEELMKPNQARQASRPTADDGREYHLHTRSGDLSPLCLQVGSPERARMIAERFFTRPMLVGDHRGLRSYTGTYDGTRISVVTTGMGAPSTGIVAPEAFRSGGRIFIRVGSCSTLLKEPKPGDVIVVTGAVRYEGASQAWAPIEYPALAHYRVVAALEEAAQDLAEGHYFLGVEATIDCFNEGQARPNVDDEIPEEMRRRHDELIRLGVACYSMEASALFVWCATHVKRLGGLPAGVVNAVYGNRRTNAFQVAGEDRAAKIALHALVALADDPGMAKYMQDRPDPPSRPARGNK